MNLTAFYFVETLALAFPGWKMGFEPTTNGTTIRYSNQLSYIHHLFCGCKDKRSFLIYTTFEVNFLYICTVLFNENDFVFVAYDNTRDK